MTVLSLKKDCYVKFYELYITLMPLRNVKVFIVQLMSKRKYMIWNINKTSKIWGLRKRLENT